MFHPIDIELPTGYESEPTFQITLTNNILPNNLDLRLQNSNGAHVQSWINDRFKDKTIKQCQKEDIKCFTKHYPVPRRDNPIPRIVGAFTGLNKVTQEIPCESINCYNIATWLTQFKYKMKLDLSWDFYNVKVDPSTSPYLGLKFGNQYFCYTRMPMSPRNSPTFFNKWMKWFLNQLSTR